MTATASLRARTRDHLDLLTERLLAPIDIASLVFFRVFFGILAFWHVWDFILPAVQTEQIDPDFHFQYIGFGWVEPLPGQLMNVVVLLMAAAAVCITLGLYYRAAAAAFFVLHSYVFLLDVANYWNHYYLVSLLAFLLIVIPAHRAYSLDVLRGAVSHSDQAPAWGLWVLRAQMAIVYFFAGLAKATSSDWWHGRPMDAYLANHTSFPLIGRWFTESWLVHLASFGGMLFDLSILPLLLWPRTRLPALVVAIAFHLTNSLIFDIQLFPWLAIAATLLFLPPSWPRFAGQWRPLAADVPPARPAPPPPPRRSRGAVGRRQRGSGGRLRPDQRALAAVLGLFFLFQLLMPLREFAYPGDPSWTTEGSLFSWRMLIADREGTIVLYVSNKTATCEVNNRSYLYSFQRAWLYNPDVLIQYARHLASEYEKRGEHVTVHAWTDISLNGRSRRAIVDPNFDLTTAGRTLGHHGWLTSVNTATHLEKPVAPPCPDPPPLERTAGEQAPRAD